MIVLAGDVGGTNARLALVDMAQRTPRVVKRRTVPADSQPGLAPLVHDFLAGAEISVERACFGLSCPIVDGVCKPTNLPWRITVADLPADIGIPFATIINDFHAVGAGLPFLDESGLVMLQRGIGEDAGGVLALIGAGTGLGQGFVVPCTGGYQVQESEGGHSDFAALDERQWRLRADFAREYGRVSNERVLCGDGLLRTYLHLLGIRTAARPEHADTIIAEGPEAVSRHALDESDAVAVEALDLFAAVYGAAAGDLALTVMSTGGVFVGGGIAPQIVEKLKDGTFMRAFLDKGRLRHVLERMPVAVITSPDVALFGAASVAARL